MDENQKPDPKLIKDSVKKADPPPPQTSPPSPISKGTNLTQHQDQSDQGQAKPVTISKRNRKPKPKPKPKAVNPDVLRVGGVQHLNYNLMKYDRIMKKYAISTSLTSYLTSPILHRHRKAQAESFNATGQLNPTPTVELDPPEPA